MTKDPMLDKVFLKELFNQKKRYIYAKVTTYDNDENPIESIEGRVTQGSINLDGRSSVRRSCSLTIMSSLDLRLEDELNWTLNTKIKVEIGMQNFIDETYDDIIWFNMGFYCISNFSFVKNTSGCTVSLQGKDKMCLLNGDLGGEIYAAVDFGTEYIIDKTTGAVTPRQIPIEDIICEAVYEYAKEPYYNIDVEDIPKFGLFLLDYLGGTPFYILVKTNNVGEAADFLFNQTVYVEEGGSWVETQLDEIPEDELNNIGSFINTQSWEDLTPIKLDPDSDDTYYACRIENGETCGYEVTDLTYPKESEEDNSLSIGVGGTITQVLDKIVEFLGDYEYFFDVNGRFVFRKKNRTINTNDWSEIDTNTTGIGVDYDLEPSETNWNFAEEELITQYNSSQKMGDIRNDFSIWGNKQTAETEVPIHLRYAIDFKPQFYRSINMSSEEIADYVNLYPEYKDAFEQVDGDYIAGAYSPVVSKIYYSKDCPFKDQIDNEKRPGESAYEVDWREIIYQMAKDYLKFKHFDQFLSRLDQNNYVKAEDRYLYPKGKTKYEQYYVDLEAFWRDLWNPYSDFYFVTSDASPQEGKTYYYKENNEYIKFEEESFSEGVIYYEKETRGYIDEYGDLIKLSPSELITDFPVYIKDEWYVYDNSTPSDYSTSENYAIGDTIAHNGQKQICISPTSGTYNSSCWQQYNNVGPTLNTYKEKGYDFYMPFTIQSNTSVNTKMLVKDPYNLSLGKYLNYSSLHKVGGESQNYYFPTTDTEPQFDKTYYYKENNEQIEFEGEIFPEGVTFYENSYEVDPILHNALSCYTRRYKNSNNSQTEFTNPSFFFEKGLIDTEHDWSFKKQLRLRSSGNNYSNTYMKTYDSSKKYTRNEVVKFTDSNNIEKMYICTVSIGYYIIGKDPEEYPNYWKEYDQYYTSPQFSNSGMGIFCDNQSNNSSDFFEWYLDFKSKGFVKFNEPMLQAKNGTWTSRSVAKTEKYNLIVPVVDISDPETSEVVMNNLQDSLRRAYYGEISFEDIKELQSDKYFDFYKIYKALDTYFYNDSSGSGPGHTYDPGEKCYQYFDVPTYNINEKYYKNQQVKTQRVPSGQLIIEYFYCKKDTIPGETILRDEEYWVKVTRPTTIYECIETTSGAWDPNAWVRNDSLKPDYLYLMWDTVTSDPEHQWRPYNQLVGVIPTYEGVKYEETGEFVYRLSVMDYTTFSFFSSEDEADPNIKDNNKQFQSRITTLEDFEAQNSNKTYHFQVSTIENDGITYPILNKKEFIDLSYSNTDGIVIKDKAFGFERDYKRLTFCKQEDRLFYIPTKQCYFFKKSENFLPNYTNNYPWGNWWYQAKVPIDPNSSLQNFSPYQGRLGGSNTPVTGYRYFEIGGNYTNLNEYILHAGEDKKYYIYKPLEPIINAESWDETKWDKRFYGAKSYKKNYNIANLGNTGTIKEVEQNDLDQPNWTQFDYYEVPIEYYQKQPSPHFTPYPNTYWNVELLNNPEQMTFWFDFLHSEKSAQISKYGADKIMDRAKSESKDEVSAICFRDVLNIIYDFGDSSPQLKADAAEAQQAIFNVPENLKSNFIVSNKYKSCKDVLDEWMQKYTQQNDAVSISATPIQFLEPNQRILTPDGEYVINSISFPLTYNGMMNINATKVVEKLQ